jgi:hypothetical protein
MVNLSGTGGLAPSVGPGDTFPFSRSRANSVSSMRDLWSTVVTFTKNCEIAKFRYFVFYLMSLFLWEGVWFTIYLVFVYLSKHRIDQNNSSTKLSNLNKMSRSGYNCFPPILRHGRLNSSGRSWKVLHLRNFKSSAVPRCRISRRIVFIGLPSTWSRCYDNNNLLRFLLIFGEKMAF